MSLEHQQSLGQLTYTSHLITKNKNVEDNVNLNDHSQFPQLVSESEPVKDNSDWAINAKENCTYSCDKEEEEYFNIGNITFKQDAQVRDGWIILNKDNSENRGKIGRAHV